MASLCQQQASWECYHGSSYNWWTDAFWYLKLHFFQEKQKQVRFSLSLRLFWLHFSRTGGRNVPIAIHRATTTINLGAKKNMNKHTWINMNGKIWMSKFLFSIYSFHCMHFEGQAINPSFQPCFLPSFHPSNQCLGKNQSPDGDSHTDRGSQLLTEPPPAGLVGSSCEGWTSKPLSGHVLLKIAAYQCSVNWF